KFNHLFLK
ncbi:hypothetical protein D030_3433B, partial [Vibrio parahaemolyticus AQ3810]